MELLWVNQSTLTYNWYWSIGNITPVYSYKFFRVSCIPPFLNVDHTFTYNNICTCEQFLKIKYVSFKRIIDDAIIDSVVSSVRVMSIFSNYVTLHRYIGYLLPFGSHNISEILSLSIITTQYVVALLLWLVILRKKTVNYDKSFCTEYDACIQRNTKAVSRFSATKHQDCQTKFCEKTSLVWCYFYNSLNILQLNLTNVETIVREGNT